MHIIAFCFYLHSAQRPNFLGNEVVEHMSIMLHEEPLKESLRTYEQLEILTSDHRGLTQLGHQSSPNSNFLV